VTCIIIIETVGLRVPNRNFSLFNGDIKSRNCPSARYAAAGSSFGVITIHSMDVRCRLLID
jgi:hypothetical protein